MKELTRKASEKLSTWTPHCAVGDSQNDIQKGKLIIYVHNDRPVGIPKEYYPMIRTFTKEHQVQRFATEQESLLYKKYYNQNVLIHVLRKKGQLSQQLSASDPN